MLMTCHAASGANMRAAHTRAMRPPSNLHDDASSTDLHASILPSSSPRSRLLLRFYCSLITPPPLLWPLLPLSLTAMSRDADALRSMRELRDIMRAINAT